MTYQDGTVRREQGRLTNDSSKLDHQASVCLGTQAGALHRFPAGVKPRNFGTGQLPIASAS